MHSIKRLAAAITSLLKIWTRCFASSTIAHLVSAHSCVPIAQFKKLVQHNTQCIRVSLKEFNLPSMRVSFDKKSFQQLLKNKVGVFTLKNCTVRVFENSSDAFCAYKQDIDVIASIHSLIVCEIDCPSKC